MSRCDDIAEAVVMGEPLSADDQGHVDGCAACRRLTALPALLAATTSAEPPRPGFSARMMAATRERIDQRRRRRFATFAVGLAAAAASAVAVDRRFVRGHDPTAAEPALPGTATGESVDPELRAALGSLSFNHAMAPVAKWTDIERPVRNYRVLLRKGGPK